MVPFNEAQPVMFMRDSEDETTRRLEKSQTLKEMAESEGSAKSPSTKTVSEISSVTSLPTTRSPLIEMLDVHFWTEEAGIESVRFKTQTFVELHTKPSPGETAPQDAGGRIWVAGAVGGNEIATGGRMSTGGRSSTGGMLSMGGMRFKGGRSRGGRVTGGMSSRGGMFKTSGIRTTAEHTTESIVQF
jgi:hypothetical protein